MQQLSITGKTSSVPGEFRAGFRAMLALWSAAIPAALAYVAAASSAGIHPFETMLLSLLMYSGPGQIAAISMLAAGASAGAVLLAVLALHIHYLLLGLTLGRRAHFAGLQRLLAAMLLTDGVSIVSNAREQLTVRFYLGAGCSMYLAWNLATLLALLAGRLLLPLITPLADMILPLVLATLLSVVVRTHIEWLAAGSAGLIALLLMPQLSGGLNMLAATLLACMITAFFHKEQML